MLEIEAVSKTYPNGVRALIDVSLTIGPGLFGLLGPNGAGKSTLMRTIVALQAPDAGALRFDGVAVADDPQRHRRRLGYLPQDFGVYPGVSALALLDHMAVLKGITDRGTRRTQVESLLALTNLWRDRHRAVSGFSGGMRQRFGIAQALLGDPRLLVVDEPTAGLDPEERHRFHNLLTEVGEQVVVILSTHIVEDVRQLCTRMAVLAGGRILCQGSPDALIRQLDGRVWIREVAKSEVARYRDSMSVLSAQLVAGRTRLRVEADAAPEPAFLPTAPDLEDVYFSALGRGTPVAA